MLTWLWKLFGTPQQRTNRAIKRCSAELWKLHRLANSTSPAGRYYLRDDEVCLSDECVAGIRNVDGQNEGVG